jgi:hypothetical protein
MHKQSDLILHLDQIGGQEKQVLPENAYFFLKNPSYLYLYGEGHDLFHYGIH